MLEVRGINVAYDTAQVLFDLTLEARAGEILCIMGRNGAGKTTTMKTIMGLLRPRTGSIHFNGEEISKLPAEKVPARQIGYIPQGRRLFSELTVAENIEIGLMVRGSSNKTRDRVLDIFPRLKERLGQRAGTLSGGEQQMLATARALCVEPKLLLLDEPTEGLQPSMIEQIRQVIIKMKSEGVAIILVEQRIDVVLEIADHVTFIENGRNLDTLSNAELKADRNKITKYLGV